MEREVGWGIGMGNTCKPMADSFQCMTKPTTIKKKKFKTFSILLSKYKYRKSVNTVQYNEKNIYMSNLFEF